MLETLAMGFLCLIALVVIYSPVSEGLDMMHSYVQSATGKVMNIS